MSYVSVQGSFLLSIKIVFSREFITPHCSKIPRVDQKPVPYTASVCPEVKHKRHVFWYCCYHIRRGAWATGKDKKSQNASMYLASKFKVFWIGCLFKLLLRDARNRIPTSRIHPIQANNVIYLLSVNLRHGNTDTRSQWWCSKDEKNFVIVVFTGWMFVLGIA